MNQNVKIANELIKLAKSLIAGWRIVGFDDVVYDAKGVLLDFKSKMESIKDESGNQALKVTIKEEKQNRGLLRLFRLIMKPAKGTTQTGIDSFNFDLGIMHNVNNYSTTVTFVSLLNGHEFGDRHMETFDTYMEDENGGIGKERVIKKLKDQLDSYRIQLQLELNARTASNIKVNRKFLRSLIAGFKKFCKEN